MESFTFLRMVSNQGSFMLVNMCESNYTLNSMNVANTTCKKSVAL